MPPASPAQSLTIDYVVPGLFDGDTPAPVVDIDVDTPTAKEPNSQIYVPAVENNLGLIDPDLGIGGSIGPRAITQLLLDFGADVGASGDRVCILAEMRDGTFVKVKDVLDLTGLSSAFLPAPVVVPQGGLLQITGPSGTCRLSVESPKDTAGLLTDLAILDSQSPMVAGGIGYSVPNAGAIPIPGSGAAFAPVVGPFLPDTSNKEFMATGTPGELEFVGSKPMGVILYASVSLTKAGGFVEGRIRLAKNGTAVPNTEIGSQVLAGFPFNLTTAAVVGVVKGDILTMEVTNLTDATDLTCIGARLVAAGG